MKFLDMRRTKKGKAYFIQFGEEPAKWMARSKLLKYEKYLDEFEVTFDAAQKEATQSEDNGKEEQSD